MKFPFDWVKWDLFNKTQGNGAIYEGYNVRL